MFSGVKRLYATPRALMVSLAVLAVTAMSAVAINTMQSQSAGAATQCHESLITYCGISGSTVDARVDKFQKLYTTNRSGHAESSVGYDYRDIQKIYNHFGATDAMVSKMNSSNTKLGTIYADGRVVVDGKLVGKDAITAGRWKTNNSTLFPGTNIYIRKPVESFSTNSMAALVYFENGVMKFGIILECANPIKATPTTTAPKAEQTLVCVDLTKVTLPGDNKYRFSVTARATNGAVITGYTINLGDGTEEKVTTAATTATVDHEYTKDGNYTIEASVNGKLDGKVVTKSSNACTETVTVKTPTPEPCPIPGKEDLPKDSPDCVVVEEEEEEGEVLPVVTPVVTPELPKTGAAGAIALVGMTSALGAAAHSIVTRFRNRR